ncbi:MAG: helix-turn-helix transcriptional regulator [Acidobacteriota bacterium]
MNLEPEISEVLRLKLGEAEGLLERDNSIRRDRRKLRSVRKQLDEDHTGGDEPAFKEYLAEWERIGREIRTIAELVRPGLLGSLWDLIQELDERRPEIRIEAKYRTLVGDLPDHPDNEDWVRPLLVDLCELLRDVLNPMPKQPSRDVPTPSAPNTQIKKGPRTIAAPQACARLKLFMQNEAGLNLGQMSKRAGVSTKTISKLLKRNLATPGVLEALAGALKITQDELMAK